MEKHKMNNLLIVIEHTMKIIEKLLSKIKIDSEFLSENYSE